MNKSELVAAVADQTGLSKSQINEVVDAVFSNMAASLRRRQDVRLPWMTLKVMQRPSRISRNPRTGTSTTVPATDIVMVKAGKALDPGEGPAGEKLKSRERRPT